MARREGETYGEYSERQQEIAASQKPLRQDEFQVFLPGSMRTLVADLKDSLKYVSGEDKKSIAEVISLLSPAGIKKKDITSRLGNRELPKPEDIQEAAFSLEEEVRDLEEKKESLAQYLDDAQRVREFYAEIRTLMVELSKMTVGPRPYTLNLNEPCLDYSKKIARIKRDYKNAKPFLGTSEFDVSGMDSAFNDYIEKQQKLVSYQVKNTARSTEEGYSGGPFGHIISRNIRISRYSGKGKTPCWFYYPVDVCIKNRGHMMGLSAGNSELEMMDESKSSKLEFDRTRQAANINLANQKREILRNIDKHDVESSLRSEAGSMKEDLKYEPMELPDANSIEDVFKEMKSAEKEDLPVESQVSRESLKDKYKKLANEYFANLPKFATGGFVDNIIARLSPGEFVLKAEAVKNVGLPFLNALNNFKFPVPTFAGGGIVDAAPIPQTTNTPSMQRDVHLNVNITGAGEITEKQVRRWIYPAINKIQRLER